MKFFAQDAFELLKILLVWFFFFLVFTNLYILRDKYYVN